MPISLLDHPIALVLPERMPERPLSPWLEHVPFALLCVDLVRPRVLAELGSYSGVSYCAFCQAVRMLGLDTRCFAVDTWQGDPHSGYYGPDILANLKAHHDPRYGGFSRLVQSTFDAAVHHFGDGSIDLLHIDGYHTYDAVQHDFETWLPKMSTQGVVLLHDTNAREYDFGAWRFWEELTQAYPHLDFLHSHGLGVVAVGPHVPPGLEPLLNLSPEGVARVRTLFYELGRRLSVQVERDCARQDVARLLAERAELARLLGAG